MTTPTETTPTEQPEPKAYDIKRCDGGDEPLPEEMRAATKKNVEEVLLKAAKHFYPLEKEKNLSVLRAAEGRLVARRRFFNGQSSRLIVAIPVVEAPPAPPES
jgi:hypothetical protein